MQNGHHGLQLVQGPCQAGLAHQLLAHHLQREQAVTEQEQPRESPAGSVLRDIFTLEVPCALSGPGEGTEPALLTLRVASNFLVSPRLFHDIPRASVQAGRGCFWAGKRNKGRKLLPREALAAPPLELFKPRLDSAWSSLILPTQFQDSVILNSYSLVCTRKEQAQLPSGTTHRNQP